MKRTLYPTILFLLCATAVAAGDEPRYVVANGVTYLETRGVERRPTANVRFEDQTETVYRTEYVTEMRDQTTTVWTPVTEYRYVPRWQNRWNVFAEPTVRYELQPFTRWELRTQTVQTPVTITKQVPETKIVRKPVRVLGFADKEYVQRVVVKSPSPVGNSDSNPTGIARQQPPLTRSSSLPRPWAAPENSPTLRR